MTSGTCTWALTQTKIQVRINEARTIGFTIFFGRNVNRLINENNQYGFNPLINPTYRITNRNFSVHNTLKKIVDNKFVCDLNYEQCDDSMGIDVYEKYGYKIFYNKSKK